MKSHFDNISIVKSFYENNDLVGLKKHFNSTLECVYDYTFDLLLSFYKDEINNIDNFNGTISESLFSGCFAFISKNTPSVSDLNHFHKSLLNHFDDSFDNLNFKIFNLQESNNKNLIFYPDDNQVLRFLNSPSDLNNFSKTFEAVYVTKKID